MRLKLLAIAALFLPNYVTSQNYVKLFGRGCGTETKTDEQNEAEGILYREWTHQNGQQRTSNKLYIVDTYWHAVENGSNVVTDETINESIRLLNRALAPHFEINLLGIERYNELSLWNLIRGSPQEEQLKSNRIGDCITLNIYTTKLALDSLLGYSALPVLCGSQTPNDGVVISYDTLPGGDRVPYNEGDTLIHEVGHWFNLIHTFEGGCEGSDQVEDTPQAAVANTGCPVGINSCPNTPPDAINNFMDYTDDSCMDTFTDGQFERMKFAYENYRCGYTKDEECDSLTYRPTSTSLPPSTPPSKVVSLNPTALESAEPSLSPSTSVMPSDFPSNIPTPAPVCDFKKRNSCMKDGCAWTGVCLPCDTQTKRKGCIKKGCLWDYRGAKSGLCITCKSINKRKTCIDRNCLFDSATKECSSCGSLTGSIKKCAKAKCAYSKTLKTCAACEDIPKKGICMSSGCRWKGSAAKGKCQIKKKKK